MVLVYTSLGMLLSLHTERKQQSKVNMKNNQDAKIRDFSRIYIVLNGTLIQPIHHSADGMLGILTIDDIIGPFNVD